MTAKRREELWIAGATVLLLLPFLSKAYSIDAPVFVAVAHQIVDAPASPFGFQMIWDPTSPEAAVFNRNPPLLSYWLAPVIAWGGSEILLRAAVLPFPVMAALAFLGIARRTTGEGFGAAALLVATPAFFVLATTLMLDVPALALMLVAVLCLLRGAETERSAFQWGAGFATAAAALMKYVGLATFPLVAAGVLLLYPRPLGPAVRVLLPPIVVWGFWGAYTAALYGAPHFFGSTDVVFDRNPDYFWNQVTSTPVYYGAALVFPVFVWIRVLVRGRAGTPLAVLGVLLGAAVVTLVLPEGKPARRHPLETEEAVLAAAGFAAALLVWATCLDPRRWRRDAQERLLMLWLAGFLVYAMFLNWHVNAADALLAAPPVILLLLRTPSLAPSRRALAIWVACMLPLSLALAFSDREQANVYRDAARRIAAEIGDVPGRRYFVGHWGLQHYLQEIGFEAVVPPQYGHSDLEEGDWIASARNVSQLDVTANLAEYEIRPVWFWGYESWLPLRTTNADASAGFYSHHSGYVPFAFSDAPLDRVGLGRVRRRKGSLGR